MLLPFVTSEGILKCTCLQWTSLMTGMHLLLLLAHGGDRSQVLLRDFGIFQVPASLFGSHYGGLQADPEYLDAILGGL